MRGKLVRKVHYEKPLLYDLTVAGRVSCCLLKRKHTLMAFKKSTFHHLSQLVLEVKTQPVVPLQVTWHITLVAGDGDKERRGRVEARNRGS